MVLMVVQDSDALAEPDFGPFPREVEFVISALEAGPRPILDRHKHRRSRYRTRALLKLYSDSPDAGATLLYTRSITPQAVGFLSTRQFTLSHGGILRIAAPDGNPAEIACTVLRCRQVAPGWYEGAVYFNRQQPMFAADRLDRAAACAC
jgi:hypothetical protein